MPWRGGFRRPASPLVSLAVLFALYVFPICVRIPQSKRHRYAKSTTSSCFPSYPELPIQSMYNFAIVSQLSKTLLFEVVFVVCSMNWRLPTLHQLLTFYLLSAPPQCSLTGRRTYQTTQIFTPSTRLSVNIEIIQQQNENNKHEH